VRRGHGLWAVGLGCGSGSVDARTVGCAAGCPEGATHTSPGQRPGETGAPLSSTLQGCDIRLGCGVGRSGARPFTRGRADLRQDPGSSRLWAMGLVGRVRVRSREECPSCPSPAPWTAGTRTIAARPCPATRRPQPPSRICTPPPPGRTASQHTRRPLLLHPRNPGATTVRGLPYGYDGYASASGRQPCRIDPLR
jgi:hypothetical protein